MSVDYAAGLSDYDDLGVCGADEVLDDLKTVKEKVNILASWLRLHSPNVVVHVGAGISTASGIPDFRGKSGVWTKLLLKRNKFTNSDTKNDIKKEEEVKQESSPVVSFDQAKPTISHMILKELCLQGFIGHIISQNVDGLFLRSNLPRSFISELHGNFFLDECATCKRRFIRDNPSHTMKLQKSTKRCPHDSCRGFLRDTILDWESPIPYHELRRSQRASRLDLHIIIGSTVQLCPARNLVLSSKRGKKHKLVIINLQPTHFDKDANLVINYYADDVMRLLINAMNLPEVLPYDASIDPTKSYAGIEWKRV